MTSMYARGRAQEYNFIYKVKKYKEIKSERVLLSGQRGEGDVLLHLPDGKTLAVEVKARKEISKNLYEWLGKHDLLALKKIGQQYDWLVTLRLDDYLALLAQSVHTRHKSHTSEKPPTHAGGHREDEDSTVL